MIGFFQFFKLGKKIIGGVHLVPAKFETQKQPNYDAHGEPGYHSIEFLTRESDALDSIPNRESNPNG